MGRTFWKTDGTGRPGNMLKDIFRKAVVSLAVLMVAIAVLMTWDIRLTTVSAAESAKADIEFRVRMLPDVSGNENLKYNYGWKYGYDRDYIYRIEVTADANGKATVPVSDICANAVCEYEYWTIRPNKQEPAERITETLGINAIKEIRFPNEENKPSSADVEYDFENGIFTISGIDDPWWYRSYCVDLEVIPDTVGVNFTMEGGYKATVKTPSRDTLMISPYDIMDNLRSDKAGFPEGKVISSIGGNEIESLECKYEIAFDAKKESYGPIEVTSVDAIKNISYDGIYDRVIIETAVAGVDIWFADVKKPKGAKLRYDIEDAFRSYRSCKIGNGPSKCDIHLSGEEAEDIRIAKGEGVYLYISSVYPVVEDEDGKKKTKLFNPTFTIEPTEYKSVKVNLNYSGASIWDEDQSAIASLVIKKQDKTTVEYSMSKNEQQFKEILKNMSWKVVGSYKKEKWTEDEGESIYDPSAWGYRLNDIPSGVYAYDYRELNRLFTGIEDEISFVYAGDGISNWTLERPESMTTNPVYRYDAYKGSTAEQENKVGLENSYGWQKNGKYVWRSEAFDIPTGEQTDPYVNKRYISYQLRGLDLSNPAEDALTETTIFTVSNKHEFVTTKTVNGEEVQKKLSDYGLSVSGNFMEGDKLLVTVREVSTAQDLGIVISIDGNTSPETLDLKEGESKITLKKIVGEYYFSAEYLEEIILNYTENSLDKGFKEKRAVCVTLANDGVGSDGKYHRCSKEISIPIKALSKQVKAKYDEKKDMIVVKNGYDYRLSYDKWQDWKTVLPNNKDGKAPNAVIATSDYSPIGKVTDNPEMFTTKKFSGISVDDILKDKPVTVTVRKSATFSKSETCTEDFGTMTCEIILNPRSDAPEVTALEDGTYGTADKKGNIILPKISKASTDKTSVNGFEYMIIDKDDYENELKTPGTLDKSTFTWSKYEAGKNITLDKSKSKYKLTAAEGKATAHKLEAGSYILIRRKGDKNKENPYEPVLASKYVVLKVEAIVSDDGEKKIVLVSGVAEETALEPVVFNNHTYQVIIGSYTWEQAKSQCEEKGGHLVCITTEEEQEFVTGLYKGESGLWIGGHCDSEGNWSWVTGEDWEYTNWKANEPSRDGVLGYEDCAVIWPVTWNDLNEKNLDEQEGFICEWDKVTE